MFTNLNLAWIVFRMVTSHRGVRVSEIRQRLDIKGRTYRKYRQRLQESFLPLQRPDGSSRIEEVKEGDVKYLRIVDVPELGWSDDDFIARVVALHFASRVLGFFDGTEVAEAMRTFLKEFEHSMRDREALLGDVLHRADRMFFEIPDAPKDYGDKRDIIPILLRAMLLCREVDVEYDSASLRGPWEMTLRPLTLASHRSALYLIAKASGYDDIRIYAVDRFLAADLTEEKFDYPSRVAYEPDEYIGGAWGVFRGDDGDEHAFELVFADKRWLKMFLRERKWHRSQRLEELDDGRLKMTFTVSSDREVWRWIRGFGDDVEVVCPAEEPPVSEAEIGE